MKEYIMESIKNENKEEIINELINIIKEKNLLITILADKIIEQMKDKELTDQLPF